MPRTQPDKPVSKVQVSSKQVHNIWVLDESSSMSGDKYRNAMSGIVEEIKSLPDNIIHSIVRFSYTRSITFQKRLSKQAMITYLDFTTMLGGMTALNDAIIEALKLVDNNEATMVKIFTDGDENNSLNDHLKAAYAISEAKSKDVMVAFIGTKNDTNKAIQLYGVDKTNTLVHKNTPDSISRSMEQSVISTVMYSERVDAGVSTSELKTNFFSKQ